MMLSVLGLGYLYGKKCVLENVSFEAKEGERIALLGENGVGKSTLLGCICRVLTPASGRVLLDGHDAAGMSPRERAMLVAYVPQIPQATGLTVLESVLLGRLPRPTDRHRERVNEDVIDILERLGILHLALCRDDALSGGERQKVAIARALIQKPRLLLLDEPTANLDMKSRTEIMALLSSLAECEGVTVIAAIHDLDLALSFADSFLMMKDNTVAARGGYEILTRENLRLVYGVDAEVAEYRGKRLVMPIAEEE